MSKAQNNRESIELPLDRLNYYNGQRLEADDLRLEQAYHMRVQRWLNKSLYPDGGIVNGLEVTKQEGTAAVIVTAGLALDTQGREIILLEDKKKFFPPTAPVDENGRGVAYLTIRYGESAMAYEQGDCTTRDDAELGVAGSSPARGGPALIRAEPVLAWRDALPPSGGDEITLARVVTTDCKVVENIDLSVQQLVDKPGDSVRQFALEGFRDIDVNNPQRVYFHIRGRQPTAVILYLRAERFSPLYYTELAKHTHPISGNLSDHQWQHKHRLIGLQVTTPVSEPYNQPTDGQHSHDIWMYVRSPANNWAGVHDDQVPAVIWTQTYEFDQNCGFECGSQKRAIEDADDSNQTTDQYPFVAVTGRGNPEVSLTSSKTITGRKDDGKHKHTITFGEQHATGNNIDVAGEECQDLPHNISGEISSTYAGVEPHPDYPVELRTGNQLAYVNDLKVLVDDVDLTTAILTQIQGANPAEHWNNVLGDGTKDHPFVVPHDESPGNQDGTGPIRLDFLENTDFTEGEHYIEFRVEQLTDEEENDLGNGGRIYYNLYVE